VGCSFLVGLRRSSGFLQGQGLRLFQVRRVDASLGSRPLNVVLEYIGSPPGQAIILVTITLMLAVVGYYVVQRFRDGNDGDDVLTHALDDFREMHDRGDLEDAEYRDVIAVVKATLQQRQHARDRDS